jgi:quinol monooxygenase YgiN
MIVGTIRILPPPNRRAEVLEVLRSIRGPVLAQTGCASCRVCEEAGPEPAILLVERWETEAAFENHLRSEAYRKILGAVELSSSPPEICFDHVSQSEGIERIERSRLPDASRNR